MQLLKDLQGNAGHNVGRTVENIKDRSARESNPRGGNQPFHRDGARQQMISDRENNVNNERHRELTGNVGARTDRGNNRWNQHDRFKTTKQRNEPQG